jgi:uncharacterized protein (DUF427 family)
MWNYPDPFEGCVDARDYVAFYWDKVDAWLEEEEEVLVGPKDPYHRVDSFRSSRHVSVVVNGETIATTDNAILHVETGLPHRYYIPKQDVRADVLRPSDRVIRSPYKGAANYYSVEVGGELIENLGWYYRYPTPEASKIANYVCFPQGKVDLFVDGELEEKPESRWD